MRNKRGISTKHSLLLILILIVTITIILVLVFRGKILETNTSLLSKVDVSLNIKSVEVGSYSSLNITVKRNQGEGKIAGMRFVFEDKDNFETVDINYLIQEGEEAQFTIDLEETNPDELVSVKIYPIMELENGELSVGSVKDEYRRFYN